MRAQVVLLRDGEILMALHRRRHDHYWVLPGGGVEPNETPEEAAVREVHEETGLDIQIERLLFVDGPRSDGNVQIRNPRYTYLGAITGGNLRAVDDGVMHAEKGRLAGAAWMPFESGEYDAATRDTLQLVRHSLGRES